MADWTLGEIASLLGDSSWVHLEDDKRVVSGVSTYFPTYRPGDIVFLQSGNTGFGIPAEVLSRNNVRPKLVIAAGELPASLEAEAVLRVSNRMEALLTLARAARKQIDVPVVAITGSSGKTSTTNLTAHALRAFGPVYGTREGGNLLRGVAWNLSCATPRDEFVVLELAIGRMSENAALAKPDVAVFTNIHLAHVVYHNDLQTIAERKARIFDGMKRGTHVILNSGMNEGAYLDRAARNKGLNVLYYGRRSADHVRLVGFDAARGIAEIRVGNTPLRIENCLRHGVHMLENYMATCAVHHALGLSLDHLAERFGSFQIADGRGGAHNVDVEGGAFVLLDHSYNANPASMRAALIHLRNSPARGRRIAVLGAMEELGPVTHEEHAQLVEYLRKLELDRVYTLGEEFACAKGLPGHVALEHADKLQDVLRSDVRADDVIMVKGSHSTGLYHVVNRFLKEQNLSKSVRPAGQAMVRDMDAGEA